MWTLAFGVIDSSLVLIVVLICLLSCCFLLFTLCCCGLLICGIIGNRVVIYLFCRFNVVSVGFTVWLVDVCDFLACLIGIR